MIVAPVDQPILNPSTGNYIVPMANGYQVYNAMGQNVTHWANDIDEILYVYDQNDMNTNTTSNNQQSTDTACRCATKTIFDAQGNCSCAEPNSSTGFNIQQYIQDHPLVSITFVGLLAYAIFGKK